MTINTDPRTPYRGLAKNIFPLHFSKYRTTAYLDVPPTRGVVSNASYLRAIAWSPLGNWVATGSGDRKLRVWNPERAHVKNSTDLRGHTTSVERVAWNPVREAELASCSLDGTVRIWDIRSKTNVAEYKPGGECFTLAWKPDGQELIVGRKVCLFIKYG
jgi:THO complex subunit 3